MIEVNPTVVGELMEHPVDQPSNDILSQGGGSSAFFGDLRQKERMATWMDSVRTKSKKVQKTKGKPKK